MIPFADYFARIEEHLERFHGIRVVTTEIPGPFLGDLDGAEIRLDRALAPEQRFFLLGHLFGHTVQWNADPRSLAIGKLHQPPVDAALLPAITDYEREAACYALSMLHQVGITAADQWFCDYTACDMAYLLHYYRTGEKRDFIGFWHDNTPLIQPKTIPAFTPTKRVSRLSGIVI
jgi:hypothetical protein